MFVFGDLQCLRYSVLHYISNKDGIHIQYYMETDTEENTNIKGTWKDGILVQCEVLVSFQELTFSWHGATPQDLDMVVICGSPVCHIKRIWRCFVCLLLVSNALMRGSIPVAVDSVIPKMTSLSSPSIILSDLSGTLLDKLSTWQSIICVGFWI